MEYRGERFLQETPRIFASEVSGILLDNLYDVWFFIYWVLILS